MPKISALTSLAQASVDTAADVLPIVDATAPATTKKVTVQAMVNAGLAAAAPQGGIFALTGALTVSGQASFAAGSAAAPSINFASDPDTGIFRVDANALGIAAGGVQVMRIAGAAGNVNGLFAYGGNTGVAPTIRSLGSDTNIGLLLSSQGSDPVDIYTNGVSTLQFRVAHTASAVNLFNVTGSTTGNSPVFSVIGTDTNIGAIWRTKGTGTHLFQTGTTTQLAVAHVASAVNYLQAAGNSTGGYPSLRAVGSDTNIGFDFSTQGAAPFRFYTSAFGAEQLRILSTSSAVNYVAITGSATGNAVTISTDGSDTNIAVVQNTKGTGSHFFCTNGGAQTQLEVVHVASAVNRLQIGGSPTGGSPYLLAMGPDTNINIYYGAKGAGGHSFASGAGLIQFQVNHVASAVNQWIVQGGATGQSPFFFANGSDTNVSAGFSLKGAGNFSFYTGTTTATQLIITHTASTVNAMTLTGSTTGQPTRIGNFGSDANPDILIAPKGTGVLRFGTHSAIAAETVTGYITIKDAAGNSRKLAVVS